MARIVETVGWENKGDYALVHVLLEDGTEGTVYVGGSVEVYFDKGRVKVWVKRPGKA